MSAGNLSAGARKAGQWAGLLLSVTAAAATGLDAQEFVRRSNGGLALGGAPFLFAGANSYDLPRMAGTGRRAEVDAVFSTARSLGFTVMRTWAFNDSPDSTQGGVIQSKPGRYHEEGLRGLDYVVAQAKAAGIRLILPLVNGWDDFGGMNQYVRWRGEALPSVDGGEGYREARDGKSRQAADDGSGQRPIVRNLRGATYQTEPAPGLHHDDFYTDPLIGEWFRSYCAMLARRVNVYTGTAYRDEPAILGWELANEPRSSDPSGSIVAEWLEACAASLRSVDPNHCIGSGEEGFDVSSAGYGSSGGIFPPWAYDGTAGISFRRNAALPSLDFASLHLYADHWNVSPGGGNPWIADHIRIARESGKGLIVGEFGARTDRGLLFDSWCTTALLEGAVGVLAWRLLGPGEEDHDGFGFRCAGDPACAVLSRFAGRFAARERGEEEPAGHLGVAIAYPNPARTIAVLSYDLPAACDVEAELFDITGARIRGLVGGRQSAGARRELIDLRSLPSGTYVVRLRARSLDDSWGGRTTGRLTVVR